jgi:hypothetical protein
MPISDSGGDVRIRFCVCFDTIFVRPGPVALKTLSSLGWKAIGTSFHSMEGCPFSILAVMPRLEIVYASTQSSFGLARQR